MKGSDATRRCENARARVANRVTKTVDLLFAGEKAGSTLDKAGALRIENIDEAELLRSLS